MNIYQNNLY